MENRAPLEESNSSEQTPGGGVPANDFRRPELPPSLLKWAGWCSVCGGIIWAGQTSCSDCGWSESAGWSDAGWED